MLKVFLLNGTNGAQAQNLKGLLVKKQPFFIDFQYVIVECGSVKAVLNISSPRTRLSLNTPLIRVCFCVMLPFSYILTSKTNKWFSWMEKNKLCWANWNITDKKETTALLMPGASPKGKWKPEMLSPAGKYIRTKLRNLNK